MDRKEVGAELDMAGAEAHNVTARRCSSVYAMADQCPVSAGSATLILDCGPSRCAAAKDHRCSETVI